MATPAGGQVDCGIDPHYFDEAENLGTTFPAALSELIDNAIASTTNDPATGVTFKVDVLIARVSPNKLELTVADAGEGIPSLELEQGMFILGRRHSGRSGPYASLNEHGMGLKNALPWITRETGREFDLRTAHLATGMTPAQIRLSGRLEVKGMRWQPSNIAQWNAWMNPRGPNKKTGTRIRFRCSTAQAYSGWEESFGLDSKSMSFESFARLLDEHLGVTYRHLLSPASSATPVNSLRTTYWKDPNYGRFWRRSEIRPIPIPFAAAMSRKTDFRIVRGSKVLLNAEYTRGFVDPSIAASRVAFYTRNERAQGFDVVVHSKVIQSRVYEPIWTTQRHGSENGFAGELKLEGPGLKTVITKDKLDWSSHDLQALARYIRKLDGSPGQLHRALLPTIPRPPSAGKYVWYGNEDDLCDMLQKAIQSKIAPGAALKRKSPAWDQGKTGIDPAVAEDLTYEDSRGFIIFEAKKKAAEPIDVYQVVMYWDGFCLSRGLNSPTRAFILASSEPKGVAWLRKFMAGRKDPAGNPYVIKFRAWSYFGLPPRTRGAEANQAKVDSFVAGMFTCA